MADLYYYSRQGCHLCETMLEELLPLVRGAVSVVVRDIDSQRQWCEKYDIRVPVIEYNGEVVSEYPLDYDAVRAILANSPEL